MFGKLLGNKASGPTEPPVIGKPGATPHAPDLRAGIPSLKLAVNNEATAREDKPEPVTIQSYKVIRPAHTIGSTAEMRTLIPDWKGDQLAGVVAPELAKSLAVLWLGLGDVALVGSAEALSSTHAMAVRERVASDMQLRIAAEISLSNEMLVRVIEICSSGSARTRKLQGGAITKDNLEIVIYDELFAAAVKAKASDIHFRIGKAPIMTADISLRMYGRFRPWRTGLPAGLITGVLGSAFGQRLISGTNSKSTLHLDNPTAFMTTNTVDSAQWNGRCNGRPEQRGYKMVIRLLESNPEFASIPTLQELGYVPSHCEILRMAVRRNFGLIVIFGSTGSGKSTTLRTFMTKETDPLSMAVYSVESPVEYEMPGVTQFSIPVDVNMSSEEMTAKFAAALRDVVRMDPDVLMVGEIRDNEGCTLTSEFTQSGHRCYTTAHGEGAVDGLARLCDDPIAMPAHRLGGAKFLSASIYQRLLPVLCSHCRLPAERSLDSARLGTLRRKFGLDPGTMYVANEAGCQHCQPNVVGLTANGTKGVTVAAEVLLPNAQMRQLAARRDWTGMAAAWRGQRRTGFGDGDMQGKTAFECALYLASQGRVSVLDIEREFEPLESYEVQPLAEGLAT